MVHTSKGSTAPLLESFEIQTMHKKFKHRDGKPRCEGAVREGHLIPQWIHNVYPSAVTDPTMRAVLADASQLCVNEFNEDSIALISKSSTGKSGGGYRLSLLVRPGEMSPRSTVASTVADFSGAPFELAGWIIWQCRQQDKALLVAKVAVPLAWRGLGYGAMMLKWARMKAVESGVYRIALASLPDRVTFYQAQGFKKKFVIKEDASQENAAPQDEHFVPGQVYMEQIIPKPPKKK